jgi:hypothetical protein
MRITTKTPIVMASGVREVLRVAVLELVTYNP